MAVINIRIKKLLEAASTIMFFGQFLKLRARREDSAAESRVILAPQVRDLGVMVLVLLAV